MANWVAFLRGVNVGGHAKLPMKPLCVAMENGEFSNVKSYIQSGNLVFDHSATSAPEITTALKTCIKSHADLAPEVLVMHRDTLAQIHADCPFLTPETDPKTLHFILLSKPATAPNLAKIEDLRAADESILITDRAAYLLAPSGIGRSKLMAAFERNLGVPTTARNLRTIDTVLSLAAG